MVNPNELRNLFDNDANSLGFNFAIDKTVKYPLIDCI